MTTETAPPVLDDHAPDHAPDRDRDVAAIRALLAGVEDAMNARDADRCVERFAADTRAITATGTRVVGRAAVRAAHAQAFAALGAARVRVDLLDVAFPRPDVAIATTGAWAAADAAPVDPGRPQTLVGYVLVREGDGWWVAARQFTRVAAA